MKSVSLLENAQLFAAIEYRRIVEQNPPRLPVIYALYDPRTDLPCYIGATSNWRKRKSDHLTQAKKTSRAVAQWLRELTSAGFSPAFVILRETTIEQMTEHELEAIAHWSTRTKLLNEQGVPNAWQATC